MKKTALDDLRATVKERDRELVRLLNERAKLSVEIGRVKAGRSAQGGAEFTVQLPGATTLEDLDTLSPAGF